MLAKCFWKSRNHATKQFKVDIPILKGMQIYHNYIRKHTGLHEKKTPAEKAGIEVDGKNKWLTLIQNASSKI